MAVASESMLEFFAQQDKERARDRERAANRKAAALKRASAQSAPCGGAADGELPVAGSEESPELIPGTDVEAGPKKMQKAKRRTSVTLEDAMEQQAAWEQHPRPRVGVSWGAELTSAHKSIAITEQGALVTKTTSDGGYRCAVCGGGAAMSSGLHFAEFTLVSGDNITVGVTHAADKDLCGGVATTDTPRGWGYHALSGELRHAGLTSDWTGRQASATGTTIGLLLDCAAGALTVYKNDSRLGVIASGLHGLRLRWMVQLGLESDAVRVPAAPPPHKLGGQPKPQLESDNSLSPVHERVRSRSQWCLEKPAGDLSLLERARAARASPVWVPSREASTRGCMLCSAAFTRISRRPQHCYHCGWLTCSDCSRSTLQLAQWLDDKKPHLMVYATNTPGSADVDSDGGDADGAGRPAIATAAAGGGGGGGGSSRGAAARVANKQEVRVCDSCYARAPAEMRIRVLVQSMVAEMKRQVHRDTTVRACHSNDQISLLSKHNMPYYTGSLESSQGDYSVLMCSPCRRLVLRSKRRGVIRCGTLQLTPTTQRLSQRVSGGM